MATSVVEDQFTLTGTLQDIRTTPASKRDVVVVMVSNPGDSTTWKLTYAPNGNVDAPEHVRIPDQFLSGPGSQESPVFTLPAGSVLRASSPGTGVTVMVNGISQDV